MSRDLVNNLTSIGFPQLTSLTIRDLDINIGKSGIVSVINTITCLFKINRWK